MLGISGTFPAVWIAHTIFGLPLCIFLLHNFISEIPGEVIEAARVDGANHTQIFFRIVIPLSLPALGCLILTGSYDLWLAAFAAFLIGFAGLALCLGISFALTRAFDGPFARIVQESLVIIGWVVIWRPAEMFLYDWLPLLRRRRLYRRLAEAKITIKPAPSDAS